MRYLVLCLLLCSGCSLSYSMSVGNYDPVINLQKEDKKIDWNAVFEAAKDDKKHVRMHASIRFKAGITIATIYIEDKGKKYEIGSVAKHIMPKTNVLFDLKTKCREWKTPFSSDAKFIIDSENVEISNIKISIVSK